MSAAKQGLKRFGDFIVPKLPHILTGVGVLGVGGTAVLTGLAVPKAQEKIAEEMVRRSDISGEPIEELTFLEKAKVSWPVFVLAATCGVATGVCIIKSNQMQANQLAAVTATSLLFEHAYDELKEGVIDKLGGDAYDNVMAHVAQRKTEEQTDFPSEEDVITYGLKEIYVDNTTGQVILMDREKLQEIEKAINKQLVEDHFFVPHNDILNMLGEREVSTGLINGFDYDQDGWFEFELSPGERNGVLCWYINYYPKPRPRYYGG